MFIMINVDHLETAGRQKKENVRNDHKGPQGVPHNNATTYSKYKFVFTVEEKSENTNRFSINFCVNTLSFPFSI